MPAPATVDEFLDLIQKSGVVDEAKLASYLTRQKEVGPLPAEPNKCAGKLVRDAVLTHFQAEQLLQGKWKRFTIGKYKVLEKLGVGGMGQVFLCEHKLMRRRVAVKVLPASKGVDDASRERFYLEARAVAALDHANIVRAYDIDQDEGLHFLVMEFVDGVNFQDLVKRSGPLDPHRACHYIYGSAIGLQYANEMGIIHRDIKPGNILVDRTGVVKILDMGLARFFHDEDDSLTKKYDENVLGTADYLAPEQAVDSHNVTIRADLYSLGGTFYYLLTGHAPFPEGSVAQKLLWHQTRDPKSISLIRPEVPAELVKVVEKLMMKDPAERYQTPAEVMSALQEYVQVPIPPPSEKELPQLSPAAMGTGGNANRAAGNTLIAGGNPLGTQSTSEFRSPFAKSPGGGGSSRENLATAAAQASQPGATTDVQVGVWDSLEADTAPREGTETQKTTKAESAKKLAVPLEAPSRRKLYIRAGIAVGVLALAGIGYGVVQLLKPDTPLPQPQALDYRKVYVTQGKGPENAATFKSVREAAEAINKRLEFDLATRKSPPVIVLLDEQHQESPFNITHYDRLKDLTIEGENAAKPTVWKAQVNASGKRLLELRGASNLTIRNVVFDADGKLDFALVLTGNLTGFHLEDVAVRGAKRSGIRFETVTGDVAKPCVLNRVRIQLSPDSDCGIQFALPERGATGNNPNASISITNCRIEGPGNVGIVIDSPLRDVDVSRNRFFQLANGFAIRQPFNADAAMKATITNNTFYKISERGFSAAEFDLPGTTDVTFARNYFAEVKETANVKNIAALPNFKSPDNARDQSPSSGDGNLATKPVVVENFTLPTPKPDDDSAFLRYPKSSPLASFGPGKVAVGFPPE